ncbi:hypothetical protein SUDANB171_03290 [Streptomyces sp. enrichment culture]
MGADYAATPVGCSASDRGSSGISLSIRLDWLDQGQDYGDSLAVLIKAFAEQRTSEYPPETCVATGKTAP